MLDKTAFLWKPVEGNPDEEEDDIPLFTIMFVKKPLVLPRSGIKLGFFSLALLCKTSFKKNFFDKWDNLCAPNKIYYDLISLS